MARADNHFSGAMSQAMLCAKPWGRGGGGCGVTLRGLTDLLTRGSFHSGYKMSTCPPAGARELIVDGPANRLPWAGTAPARFWGGNCREQRKKGREGPAGDAEATREHVLAASRAHGGGRRAAATARPPRTSQVRLPACP